MTADAWRTAVALLRVSGQLVDGIQQGMRRQGFDDVRPAHGFAFAMLAAGPATTVQLAEHLGVTKQAASELVAHLVERGYLRRRPDPGDGRRILLELTARGRGCMTAAESAAREVVRGWRGSLSARQADALATALRALAEPGPLRPAW